MAGALATAIRTWFVLNYKPGTQSWGPGAITYSQLGLTDTDFDGAYFSNTDFLCTRLK